MGAFLKVTENLATMGIPTPSLYTVGGIIVLDNDGHRIISKYFTDDFSTLREKKDFEKKIFEKTRKRDDEILLLDGNTITYKSNVDLMFYVIGSQDENELLLANVLNCFTKLFPSFCARMLKSALFT